jgi:two-component system response regulator FlrC
MRLLIIGELEGQIGAASKIAKSRGAKVSQVPDIESAMQALRNGQGADLIMIDVNSDIAQLVNALTNERITLPVVACGVHSDSQSAVKAIKSGAKEYLPLPPDEELIAAVLEAITEETHAIVHASAAMKSVLQMAEQIATSDANILLTGESGTGKEVIAHFVHRKSKRAGQNFISVNCAAIPETLLESELFGYEKGAFTGAVARRLGKFEEANNGTLLLDEISEMDVRLQSKLLRAIQEQEIDRIGGTKPIKINIRIIATSNRNLLQEVKKGTFREDLYFRLNVINIHIPPLRDRLEDVPPIAQHFAEKYSKANGLPVRVLTSDAIARLQRYGWPGNVRELENIMHRSVLLAKGSNIDAEAVMLPGMEQEQVAQVVQANESAAGYGGKRLQRNDLVGRTVDSVERELILDTLDYCLGNRTHAANILGISIRTLRNKLKLYTESGQLKQAEG